MSQNFASHHMDNEQWGKVDEALNALAAALEPILTSTTASQLQRLVKMGDGSEPFCRQAADVIGENLHLMPRAFDYDEMRRDLGTHDALNARMVRLTKLTERVRHTEMVLGSDVMMAALEGYNYLKTAGKGEGVEALKKMLGKRFDTTPRTPEPAPTPTATPLPTPSAPQPAVG